MNYSQVLDYMYRQLPMYQRVGSKAFKKDLGNIIALCNALENPQNKFKTIHIAGTNGKGSVAHMLASVFQQAGFKTGLYTSPHLKDFRERIKINGNRISKYRVTTFINNHKNIFQRVKPSFFEMTVAMAFDHFALNKVDIAIIETGLGGRLDSTNIIQPEISIITNVSIDHASMLGNTVKKIAKEKAGIIKENVPVVLGEYNKENFSIIQNASKKNNADLYLAAKTFTINNSEPNKNGSVQLIQIYNKKLKKKFNINLDLLGKYQALNVCTVMQALEVLKLKFKLNDKHILTGLRNTSKNTGLLGRWQILNRKPLIILDAGHNEDAINKIMLQIKNTKYDKLHIVFGMVNDKLIDNILKLLPTTAIYYFCKANIERGLNADLLMKKAMKYQLEGNSYQSVKKALKAAKSNANNADLIFIGGSTFVCAEIL